MLIRSLRIVIFVRMLHKLYAITSAKIDYVQIENYLVISIFCFNFQFSLIFEPLKYYVMIAAHLIHRLLNQELNSILNRFANNSSKFIVHSTGLQRHESCIGGT